MHYLIRNWSFDPFILVIAVTVIWHEIGLARLARRSLPEQTKQRRTRSIWFHSGLAVVLLSVVSPLGYWANHYFFVHMIQHLLLMFAAPSLIVAGAPWQPLLDGLPGQPAREATRETLTGGWSQLMRAVGGFLLRPWVAVIAFNLIMVAWYQPALFDLAATNSGVRVWLMHGSYLAVGVLFWLQFIPSSPMRIKLSRIGQAAALLLTNGIMWVLAMSMSLLTQASWYPVYHHLQGGILSPYTDQQLGAAILWVCGEFWAAPAFKYVVRRALAEDDGLSGVSSTLDRVLGRSPGRSRKEYPQPTEEA